MRILKPEGIEIEFDDKKRHLLFNLNVIDAVQEKYDGYIIDILDSISNNTDNRNAYGKISYILYALLNEDTEIHNSKFPDDKWDQITEEYINRTLLTNETMAIYIPLIFASFNGSLPKNEDDDDPNRKSGKTKN